MIDEGDVIKCAKIRIVSFRASSCSSFVVQDLDDPSGLGLYFVNTRLPYALDIVNSRVGHFGHALLHLLLHLVSQVDLQQRRRVGQLRRPERRRGPHGRAGSGGRLLVRGRKQLLLRGCEIVTT